MKNNASHMDMDMKVSYIACQTAHGPQSNFPLVIWLSKESSQEY